MSRNTEKMSTDVESMGMTLGKRLGRLEISGVEIMEQLVTLVDRCEVVEEALVEEHSARENDDIKIKRVEGKLVELGKFVRIKIEEEKNKENYELRTRIAMLEEEQMDLKKNFLSIVESCEVMEAKLEVIVENNVMLVKSVKDLENEKESLMKSLTSGTKHMTHPSGISTPVCLSNSPPLRQPSPATVGVVPGRTTHMFQPMMFPPPPMCYHPVPPQYMQNPYAYPTMYQDTTQSQYPSWSEQEQ